MTPDAWRASGTDFDWRGHRIFSRTSATTGEPLLLIHGFPTASWDWAPIWDALAARHRLLTLDMIGFGFSAKPRPYPYSILAQADLFEAFLDHHHIARCHVLAHDYGVTVAQELLARDRGRIASICFLNGGLFPETHRALPAQRILASRVGPLVVRALGYKAFARSMHRVWGTHRLDRETLAGMWQLVTASDGVAVLPALLGYIAERRALRARWVGALVDARMPVRLIVGMDDPVSGAHMAARYRQLVPRPNVVELDGVGHYPQVEAAREVVAAF